MSSTLDFLKAFASRLREAGISFAVTSGMACVHYGLQQTTKDSDWVIPAEELARLRAMLSHWEGEVPGARISYRQICGAPLEAGFMAHGWTSHLSIWDIAGSPEHKVDVFSHPPRVKVEEITTDAEGWASQHMVAQMKKTDRDKDWPMVDGLGQRLWRARQSAALLHLTHLDTLQSAWLTLAEVERLALASRRPLLGQLAPDVCLTRGQLERLLLVERLIWTRVNQLRYRLYAKAWKEFYRRWRIEEEWRWPTSEPFEQQHLRLVAAARRHGLSADPLGEASREALARAAVSQILDMGFATTDIEAVLPPLSELLP